MSSLKKRVLVVGTTPDYIEYIRKNIPGRAVFITDPDVMENSDLTVTSKLPVKKEDELVCPLRNDDEMLACLAGFLDQKNILLTGVACFDCESLLTASVIAEKWKLFFASHGSILCCRDKFMCKKKWAMHNIPCPMVREINCLKDIIDFTEEAGLPVILKPVSGSGSELVLKINHLSDVNKAYETILHGLKVRSKDRMYLSLNNKTGKAGIICEEFIDGDEFSCDVFYDKGRVTILRISKKYFTGQEYGCGVTAAYEISADLPGNRGKALLKYYLGEAADALGLTRSLFMADFIWHNDAPCFIELSPRPGGDCLPGLIRHSCGMDIIGLELDFAEGLPLAVPEDKMWKRRIGVRFHAEHAGILKSIEISFMEKLKDKIEELTWTRRAGDHIKLPPEDYNSWFLGYAVFSPENGIPVKDQIQAIVRSIHADIV